MKQLKRIMMMLLMTMTASTTMMAADWAVFGLKGKVKIIDSIIDSVYDISIEGDVVNLNNSKITSKKITSKIQETSQNLQHHTLTLSIRIIFFYP